MHRAPGIATDDVLKYWRESRKRSASDTNLQTPGTRQRTTKTRVSLSPQNKSGPLATTTCVLRSHKRAAVGRQPPIDPNGYSASNYFFLNDQKPASFVLFLDFGARTQRQTRQQALRPELQGEERPFSQPPPGRLQHGPAPKARRTTSAGTPRPRRRRTAPER